MCGHIKIWFNWRDKKNIGKIYLCFTCIILLLTAPHLGHIRNTVLTLPGHYENSLRFDVKYIKLFLLIYWLKQIATLFWVPVCWSCEKEELRLRVRVANPSVVDISGKNTCETVAFLLLPSHMLHFTCAEDGAVLAQHLADAHNGSICCWTHPQRCSLCNHIRPGQWSTDPVSCRTERRSLFDSGRNLKHKIHFCFNRDVSGRVNGTCSAFVKGVAVGHLLSPPEAHHFHAPVVGLCWWYV